MASPSRTEQIDVRQQVRRRRKGAVQQCTRATHVTCSLCLGQRVVHDASALATPSSRTCNGRGGGLAGGVSRSVPLVSPVLSCQSSLHAMAARCCASKRQTAGAKQLGECRVRGCCVCNAHLYRARSWPAAAQHGGPCRRAEAQQQATLPRKTLSANRGARGGRASAREPARRSRRQCVTRSRASATVQASRWARWQTRGRRRGSAVAGAGSTHVCCAYWHRRQAA